MKYRCFFLDLWGNEEDGWTVNNRHHMATVDLPSSEDVDLHSQLVKAGMLGHDVQLSEIVIGGEAENLTVNDLDGKPILELELMACGECGTFDRHSADCSIGRMN